MKTFFKIFLFAGIAAAFTSCGEVEPVIFNGDNTGMDTYLSFSRSNYNLPIERDQTGSVVVTLNASTLSDADRTYIIEVIPNDGIYAANPATYSVPAQVTIPAGEYQGTFTINGTDGGLVTGEPKTFSIKVADSSLTGEYVDSNIAVVSVFEVCALQSPFLGSYMLEQQTTSIFEEIIIPDGIVQLVEGDSPYERRFTAVPWPAYNTAPQVFYISFKCDFLNLRDNTKIDVGVGCDAGIFLGEGEIDESYDTADDSVFFLTMTNDKTKDCSDSEQITFKLTKQ